MRVVVEVPDDRSGTGTYARELMAGLNRAGRAPGQGPVEVVPAPYERLSKARYGRPLSRLLNSVRMVWWAQGALPLACRRARADMLHCPAFVCPVAAPCPVVLTVFDLTHVRYPETMDWIWRAYLRLFFRASVRRADRIVTTTVFSAREIEAHCPAARGKVSVTPMAASPRFVPAGDRAAAQRSLAKLGIAPPYFLFTGTLNPRKNIPRMLEGFARFKRATGLPHRLVLAGAKGWALGETERVLTPLAAAGEVVLTGYLAAEDLLSLYQGAEGLLMVSLYEGFGLPILEAMACGCPVVTSNCSSMPEVAGEAAVLVDPSSPDAIAEAIGRVARDGALRAALAERGIARAAGFSFDRMAAETLRIYDGLLARAEGRRRP